MDGNVKMFEKPNNRVNTQLSAEQELNSIISACYNLIRVRKNLIEECEEQKEKIKKEISETEKKIAKLKHAYQAIVRGYKK